jgi:MFS family permease
MAATVGMMPPLLPLIGESFTLSPVGIGLVNTVYSLGRLAGSYPAAHVRARWGTRTAAILGIGTIAFGSVGCGLGPGYPTFLAGRLVMGVGASAIFVAIFAELLEAAPPRWRGRIANAFEGVAIAALAVGGMLAASLAAVAGWRSVFAAAAGVTLLGLIPGRWIPWTAGRRPAARRGAPEGRAGAPSVRSLAPVYVACFALAFTWAGLFVTLAPLLGHQRYGLDAGALGLAFAASYAAELSGLVGIALVIDRVRSEPLFLAGGIAVAGGGLLMALAARPAFFVVGLALVGGGFSVWMVPATLLAARAGTPIPAWHLAAYRMALDAGTILGPMLVGAAAEVVGDRVTAGTAGLVTLAGAFALLRR